MTALSNLSLPAPSVAGLSAKLNRTPASAVKPRPSAIYLDIGASWTNLGVVGGGSHADNFQWIALGINLYGYTGGSNDEYRAVDAYLAGRDLPSVDERPCAHSVEQSGIGDAVDHAKYAETERFVEFKNGAASAMDALGAESFNTYAIAAIDFWSVLPPQVIYTYWSFGPGPDSLPSA